MLMEQFLTHYTIRLNDGSLMPFSSYVWARGWEHAEEICKRRGLGEQVDGILDGAAEPIPQVGSRGFTHWLMFVGFVALRSGHYSIDSIIGDAGIVHEMIHIADGVETVQHDDPIPRYEGLLRDLGLTKSDIR